MTLVLITSVPGHCLSFTSDMLKGISLKTTNNFFLIVLLHVKNLLLKTIQLHKSAASYKNPFLHICEKGPYQLHVNKQQISVFAFAT